MGELTVERLIRACGDDTAEAGITIRTELEPVAGPGAPVKPAVYEGGKYQFDRRWWGDGEDRKPVDVVVIDNVPSQANRCEAALERLRERLGLPVLELDLQGLGLPPHLPEKLSSFRFPHRNADAYLRDSQLGDDRFLDTEIGAGIFDGTADNPTPLLQWMPHALLYGFWQSHLGRKRSQAKLARSWVSEIVGYVPAATDVEVLGLKGDPLNLSVDDRASFNEDDLVADQWELLIGTTKSQDRGRKRERLSELGHGQVPVSGSPAGISFASVMQTSTVSFASLRRIHTSDPSASAAARALLASLGLVAHVGAFGRAFSLRSGADLRPRSTTWIWLGADEDEALSALSLEEAEALFHGCVERAESAGLPVGSLWQRDPIVLRPNEALTKAINATWPNDAER